MRAVPLPGFGIAIPSDVCAELGPVLVRLLDRARNDRIDLRPDVVETIERVDVEGAKWRNGKKSVPSGSASVPEVGDTGSAPVQWVSVTHAAELLAISTRAVRKRLAAGSLCGKKVGRSWQIDLASVQPSKEAAA